MTRRDRRAPRRTCGPTAPKIVSFEIPIDKIGEVIGPKGKVINTIQQETGADIAVSDDGMVGTVSIGSKDGEKVEEARRRIELILDPPTAEIGAEYTGRVVNITKFGAFVNILPGRDGLLHISKLGRGKRIDRVEDVLDLGDEVTVRVDDIDNPGKLSLSLVGDEGDDGGSGGGGGGGDASASAAPRDARRPRRRRSDRRRTRRPAEGRRLVRRRPGTRRPRGVRRSRPGRGRRAAAAATVTAAPRARAVVGDSAYRRSDVRQRRYAADHERSWDEIRASQRRGSPSGLRVLTESMPELRSVAVGFWVGTGARRRARRPARRQPLPRAPAVQGHRRRAPRSRSPSAIESVGGDMNAFTTQEYTAFYVRVPDDQPRGRADILSDVVWSPAFRPDEVDSERQVILEEIRMRDDTPDDIVHELFAEALYPKHPLGRSVLGTPRDDRGR